MWSAAILPYIVFSNKAELWLGISNWADLWFANYTVMFPQLSNISGWKHLGYVSKGPAQAPCIQQKPAAGSFRLMYARKRLARRLTLQPA